MKKIIQLVLVFVLAFALVACKKESGGEAKQLKSISVVTNRNVARVQVGHTLQCSYKVTPAGVTVDSVRWSVNNQLGTISETGLFTAGNEPGLVKITVEANGITGSKSIQITLDEVPDFPDLNEYTIKIAQATSALGETNPFLPIETAKKYGYYSGADREARQEAWTSVEEDFNCHITVVEYPSDAPWGPSRWSYIINQARLDSPEYDLYTIPDAQIPNLAAANALVDLTDWYNRYGNDFMNTMTKTAGSYLGRLYSISWVGDEVYNILGYNVGLWEKIHDYDPSIKEPAQMFLDEEWNFTQFIAYAKKCQDALNSLYGNESGYYVLSGWPSFWFVGMVDRNGEGVADVAKRQVHIMNEDATNAIDALKEICEYGAFDTAFSVDAGVVSWSNGKSLFNTGELWFIGSNQGRWDSDMWGEGEATRYGYVPFPAPDGYETLDKMYIGLVSEACWVMAAGRENYYKGYGEECTTENIYYAITEYWQRSKSIYRSADNYDEELALTNKASSKFGSQASIEVFVKVNMALKTSGFYDPMAQESNVVCATYASDFDIALRNYVKGTGAATWAEAVGGMQDTLNDSIQKAFG